MGAVPFKKGLSRMRADFRLGDWIVRPRRGRIERGGEVVPIQHKSMAVLECLAATGGEVITRDELFDTVWPGVIVTDNALSQCVLELRRAFGDPAGDPKIIKTIPKVGFCLVTPVKELEEAPAISAGRLRFLMIGILAVAVAVFAFYEFVLSDDEPITTAAVADERPSVAVLPFSNRSANPEDAFFVDGIHDDLLSHISKIGSIRTISSTSVMKYRDADIPIPQIAEELGVNTVIEGGVQRAGEQVRINVQLIDARTDSYLWSETYDRQLSAVNIFAIQSEIAEAVAAALQTTLSPAEQKRIRAIPTDNLDAYEAYLIGKQRMVRYPSKDLAEAAGYFRKAVELDPGFALAWVGLADSLQLQGHWYNYQLYTDEVPPEAEAALTTALELDESLGEAHASLGLFKHWTLHDHEGAEQSFKQALDLNPNYATGYLWYGKLLLVLERPEEAEAMLATAVQLDPMSAVIRLSYALPFRFTGRFDEAMEELQKVIEIDPSFLYAHNNIGGMQQWVYNRYDEAARSLARAISLDPNYHDSYFMLGVLFMDLGDLDRADLLFQHSIELSPSRWGRLGRLMVAILRGDHEAALERAGNVLGKGSVRVQGRTLTPAVALGYLRDRALAAGRYSEALALYEEVYPQLLAEQEPEIDLRNYWAAIDLAPVLRGTGDRDRADLLLERALAFVYTLPRLGIWRGTLASDVEILALQGKHAEALAALREAVDEGWRALWRHFLLYEPNLDSIRDEPEFQAIVDEIEADMAAQLERVREMERNGELDLIPGFVAETSN